MGNQRFRTIEIFNFLKQVSSNFLVHNLIIKMGRNTPLMWACARRHYRTIDVILSIQGVRLDIRNNAGGPCTYLSPFDHLFHVFHSHPCIVTCR